MPLVFTVCHKMATILGAIDNAKQSVSYLDSFGAKREQKSCRLDPSGRLLIAAAACNF